jgi:signal transduction histidine kinase
VIEWWAGRHRHWLIRSYLALAGGLMIAAVVLDFAFGYLQERQARADDPWVESTFRLIESTLAVSPPADRAMAARDLARRLGLGVQILELSDISTAPPAGDAPQALVDDASNTYYLKRSTLLDAAIRVGPVNEPSRGRLLGLLPALFYLSILAIVGIWLRPLLKDLQLLTAASQKFASDYREPLSTASQTTQLTSLARNLDDMSGRLSHLIQSQKEMTAALSHEMRTPLARIRFALAVAGNEASQSLQSQLRDVHADVEQIDGLIASMLDYARLDHPDLRMQWQDTPLETWLQHALAASASTERDVETVRVDGIESAWMEPRLMELALSNLVVNACRYARRHVAVTLSAAPAGNRIVVEDDGEGIPGGERELIFKAFTRLDTSRNRSTGGYGLGLAIVARIAALHGGRARASSSERLGGAKFTLEWPRPAASVPETNPLGSGAPVRTNTDEIR